MSDHLEGATAVRPRLRRVAVGVQQVTARAGHQLATINHHAVHSYSRLPTAGRSAIRMLYTQCKLATTVGQLRRRFAALAGTVAIMTVGHGAQMGMGIAATIRHADQLAAGPTPLNLALTAFDALYTAANAGAIHTQLSVTSRVARTQFRRVKVGATVAPGTVSAEPSGRRLAGDLAFTLAGQAAFVTTMYL